MRRAARRRKPSNAIAALQNALRYATHEDFDGNICTAEAIRDSAEAERMD
jgi:hypothetical protein